MFKLPKLNYAYNELEPYIDAQTMEIHHTRHHQWYTDKLNQAIEWTELEWVEIIDILSDLENIPSEIKSAVINNGGGYYNHMLFWECMTPWGLDMRDNLKLELEKNFWSVEKFKSEFEQSAITNFGSGRTRLVKDINWNLKIENTSNQDTPLSMWQKPLLCIDTREHAYYIKYQNRRPEYITNRWNIVNWEYVEFNNK